MSQLINKKPGISFILRARNEEAYLAQSLTSLLDLTIAHEIIVILHKCTDQSKAIALIAQAKGQPIRIYETNANLSKAGYETLATPTSYNESLASFYSQCFSFGQYNWLFKWDADFVASSELLKFLNTELVSDETNPLRYLIPCQMSENVINKETYLFNCLAAYKKYIFWETPAFLGGSEIKEINAKIFTIPHTILKEYWKEPPWFINKNTFLEARYKKIVELCGPEPVGASRAQCKDCEGPYFNVLQKKEELENLGIILIE
jgi:glycosyltransferase involved in cell wall biosynthesis